MNGTSATILRLVMQDTHRGALTFFTGLKELHFVFGNHNNRRDKTGPRFEDEVASWFTKAKEGGVDLKVPKVCTNLRGYKPFTTQLYQISFLLTVLLHWSLADFRAKNRANWRHVT
jgi:hypothetical protein